ncbi:hypothetical protein DACRYDRAFT_115338 [Dacryopinax primogenitus]|uniref:Glyoxalase/fosfomycin resistance/dioxygenase domain-containing protein n=1 Tax=Dacryopinax primogenitus (strain DJM 731) TaxID=1858805 RepID=M5FYF1_DACPD|nr:uncharacterized protein DACRYDRAFT_115338 [Dacryopinax primogenitus]EJU03076.1 hypothetical protein DACRYDRAFT_115338 [Dacryopinax primogenitus]
MATLVNYIACNDVDATVQWYCDVLGFQSNKSLHFPGQFAHVYLDGPDARASRAQLMLRRYPHPEKEVGIAQGTKPSSMQFFFDITDEAKGKEAVDEKYKSILQKKESGLEVTLKDAPNDQPTHRAFTVIDPNGHEISFFVWT